MLGEPTELVKAKLADRLNDLTRQYIERSPFVCVATGRPDGGMDVSPRGDPPGFVRVRDRRTVLLPDRRGNNRIDSLRNIVRDPRISLLFMIPGIDNTLRINGRAEIVTDAEVLASFAVADKVPKSVLVVGVERIYFQCPKALVRSRLWSKEAQIARSELPSTGAILESLSKGAIDGAAYDRGYPQRLKETIY